MAGKQGVIAINAAIAINFSWAFCLYKNYFPDPENIG
jgi:hypothetical protein